MGLLLHARQSTDPASAAKACRMRQLDGEKKRNKMETKLREKREDNESWARTKVGRAGSTGRASASSTGRKPISGRL